MKWPWVSRRSYDFALACMDTAIEELREDRDHLRKLLLILIEEKAERPVAVSGPAVVAESPEDLLPPDPKARKVFGRKP